MKRKCAELRCNECKMPFKRRAFLDSHKQTQHSQTFTKILCPFWPRCKRPEHGNGLYSTKTNLRVHFKKHHKHQRIPKRRYQKFYLRKSRKLTNYSL